MSNEDGSVWVAFNGEIYNFMALRQELLSHGYRFDTRSDTEVVVKAYEEWGSDFLAHLNGMFAIALWDDSAGTAVIARDRLGVKPLYIAHVNGTLVFASELKAILLHPQIPRDLDEKAISDFLARRFPLGDRTPLRAVRRLLPGHACYASNDGVEIAQFWQLPREVRLDANMSPDGFTGILEDSVRRQLISDVPVGISLSGGLDSSILAAIATRVSPEEVSTFTAGFGGRTDEVDAAREVAESLGTSHREVTLSFEEMTSKVPAIAWYLDEPIADPAILPTYFLMEFARQGVKVGLLGEGSDELFGGYSHYSLGAPPLSFLPIAVRRKMYNRVNLLFTDTERRSLLGDLPSGNGNGGFLDDDFSRLPFAEEMMRSELKNVLPSFQLHRVDRMSMAHGFEARVPYLDDSVVDAAMQIGRRAKVRPLVRKAILRQAARALVPRGVVRRRKRIFRVPLHAWLSEVLGEAMEAQLDTSTFLEGALREEHVRRQLSRQTWRRSERGAYKAWMIAMLDLWHRTFIERGRADLNNPIRPPW